jgi:hypothetical protein
MVVAAASNVGVPKLPTFGLWARLTVPRTAQHCTVPQTEQVLLHCHCSTYRAVCGVPQAYYLYRWRWLHTCGSPVPKALVAMRRSCKYKLHANLPMLEDGVHCPTTRDHKGATLPTQPISKEDARGPCFPSKAFARGHSSDSSKRPGHYGQPIAGVTRHDMAAARWAIDEAAQPTTGLAFQTRAARAQHTYHSHHFKRSGWLECGDALCGVVMC